MRFLLLLFLLLPARALAQNARPVPGAPATCRTTRLDWLAQFAIRRATHVDSTLVRAQRGGLAVQAREAAGAIDSVLPEAQLRVFRGDRDSPTDVLAVGSSGSDSWFNVDAPAPALTFVHARWYGYVPRGEVVQLRVGYRDTVVVHLRYDLVCLPS